MECDHQHRIYPREVRLRQNDFSTPLSGSSEVLSQRYRAHIARSKQLRVDYEANNLDNWR
jgi:hypothetical protein